MNNWKDMKEGDKKAFLAIYKQHYQSLFSYGFSISGDKELTKDSLQEMFLELWHSRSSLNPEVLNIRTYLCTWLRRKINAAQLKNKRGRLLEDSLYEKENNEYSYEDLLIAFEEKDEKKEKIAKALQSLSKKQIEIIRMKYFENLSYEEISSKTSLTLRTVYNTVFTAIKRLREEINSDK
ncbi:MAG: sigma-70 family RNA polymerase sigma factor [Ginsengibacter sp.]